MTTTTIFPLILFISALAIAPASARAASISLRPIGTIEAGTSGIAEVVLDTEGETINVVEGSISIKVDSRTITSLSTGGSALTLWPNKPSLSGNSISFVGGIPQGATGSAIPLFRILLNVGQVPSIRADVGAVSAYLNDGKATKRIVAAKSMELAVAPTSGTSSDATTRSIMSDTAAPQPFTIEIGRDPSLFGGKYFISFNTIDAETGVARYEVIEGSHALIRTGSPYVLRDQTLKSVIVVRAVDMAGNVRTESLNTASSSARLIVLLIALALIAASIYLVRLFTSKK